MGTALNLFTENPAVPPPPVAPLTMSSREIAEVTGKDHGNVIRDIQTMLGKLDESNLSHDDSKRVIFQKDYRGYISEILLPKLLVITLITGYRPDLRYKIIARWDELETQHAGSPLVNLTDPAVAALALAERYKQYAAEYQLRKKREEEIAALEKQKALLAPKAQIADRIAKAKGLHTMNEAAKILQTGRTRLFVILRMKQIFMSDNLPYQRYQELGYFVVKEKVYEQGGSEHLYSKTLVTGKGLNWLARLIDEDEGAFHGEKN